MLRLIKDYIKRDYMTCKESMQWVLGRESIWWFDIYYTVLAILFVPLMVVGFMYYLWRLYRIGRIMEEEGEF